MLKKNPAIPVNSFQDKYREGIFIARTTFNGSPNAKEVEQSHRDEGHLFIVQEKGTTHIEIDFQKQTIEASSVIYIHPTQVHRLISFDQATVSSLIITSENLQPEYLTLLEELAPAQTLPIESEALAILVETAALCIKLAERKNEKLYHSLQKESCNTLVALVVSQYLAQSKSATTYSRFDVITRAFKSELEQNFKTVKSPTDYANALNISTPYLNECVKNTTGYSVSHHIQQRIILEAERLLYHSTKSVKEIASELGYDDYSYFTRLFTKITAVTPSVFRERNLE